MKVLRKSLPAVLTALVYVLLLPSCSVKEDRSQCTTEVTSVLSHGGFDGNVSIYDASEGAPLGFLGDYGIGALDGGQTLVFPRGGEKTLVYIGGLKNNILSPSEGTVLIREGDCCDPLRAETLTVDLSTGSVTARGDLRRLSIPVLVDLVPAAGAECPYRVLVKGGVVGYSLPSLDIIHGRFIHIPSPLLSRPGYSVNDGLFRFYLPRQDGVAPLQLEVYGTPGVTQPTISPDNLSFSSPDAPAKTFDLYALITDAGFDLGAESLSSSTVYIRIEMNYSTPAVSVVSIGDWTEGGALVFDTAI